MGGNWLQFRKGYLISAILLLIIEICIALFLKDKFVRPYVGDFLVVILMYCVVKAFLNISVARACIAVLAFACFIECLQYANVLKLAGLEHVKLLNIVLGHSFDWADLVAYTAGIVVTYIVEKLRGADA
jgi:uncharacterized membrane protein